MYLFTKLSHTREMNELEDTMLSEIGHKMTDIIQFCAQAVPTVITVVMSRRTDI